MSRLFLSHSSADHSYAQALRLWLAQNGWEDVFLDIDPARGLVAGEGWQEALRRAEDRCEAVLFVVSPDWARSKWCLAEFLLAKSLHKRILGVIVKDVQFAELPAEMTSEWQLCRLVGHGATEAITVHEDGRSTTIEFTIDGLERLKAGLHRAGLSADHFHWPPPNDPTRSPYRGLEPLDVIDAAVFFGRDAEILHGLDQLRGLRATSDGGILVILGPSGAGKSSFLRAGLLPRLQRDDRHFFCLDVITPERGPLFGEAGLARAIAMASCRVASSLVTPGDIKARLRADTTAAQRLFVDLHAAVSETTSTAELHNEPTVVIAVDQAEHLFDAAIGTEGHVLLEILGAILRSTASAQDRVKCARFAVVLTIRSDRYEPLQTAPELAGIRTVVFDRLRAMSLGQFKEVITGPAARSVVGGHPTKFEPDLVNTILAESAAGADTLPLLSLTLRRLYEDYAAHGNLNLRHYQGMGGLSEVINTEIDAVLAANEPERHAQLDLLHEAFIPWLVTVSTNGEPLARVAKASELPAESMPLIEDLVGRRLLTRDVRGTDHVIQVAHESLLRHWGVLQSWLTQDSEDLREIDRLEQAAVAWARSGRRGAWLITGERLLDAETLSRNTRYASRLESIREFLAVSRRRERRSQFVRVSAGLAGLLALAITAWIAFSESDAPLLRANAVQLDEAQLDAMINERDFFERTRNPDGTGYAKRLRQLDRDGEELVVDDANQLTWQRSGSTAALNSSEAVSYVSGLNDALHAGFVDWRLPTVEETLSLLRATPTPGGVYVDNMFDRTQQHVWTADRTPADERWSLSFRDGTVAVGVTDFATPSSAFVRAVRSGTSSSAVRFSRVDLSSITNAPWEQAGIWFPRESVKPPRGMTRGGVPFLLRGGPRAVFLTSVTGHPERPTEASIDVDVQDPLSAHVLISAAWLPPEVFKGDKVGEIEYHFDDRVIRTDLIGWRSVRESWNAFDQALEPVESSSAVLTNFFSEPQLRAGAPGKDPSKGFGVIDMLSTKFGESGAGTRLRRIVMRDTSTPKSWRDPNTNTTYTIDPGLGFMGITLKIR